jgi:hypothetical protein
VVAPVPVAPLPVDPVPVLPVAPVPVPVAPLVPVLLLVPADGAVVGGVRSLAVEPVSVLVPADPLAPVPVPLVSVSFFSQPMKAMPPTARAAAVIQFKCFLMIRPQYEWSAPGARRHRVASRAGKAALCKPQTGIASASNNLS